MYVLVPDTSVDFIVAFSVFTHLLYDQNFIYLRDACRALNTGGVTLFSLLEMRTHWWCGPNVLEW